MSKAMSINGMIATFIMTLKGNKLPDSFEASIEVRMDFTGATELQLMTCCAGGSSARVQLQGQLRKLNVAQLRQHELTGYDCKFTQIVSGAVQVDYKTALMALDYETFIVTIMEDLSIEEEVASKYYTKLTGKEIPTQ